MAKMSRRKRSDVSPKSKFPKQQEEESYIVHILESHHTLAGIALQYRYVCVYYAAGPMPVLTNAQASL